MTKVTIAKVARISVTPEPPYYSVTTTAILNEDLEGYYPLAEELFTQAKDIEGFLGLEACIDADCGIAVSYWKTTAAIQEWRTHAGHSKAKQIAKKRWFNRYITRIAKVEGVY